MKDLFKLNDSQIERITTYINQYESYHTVFGSQVYTKISELSKICNKLSNKEMLSPIVSEYLLNTIGLKKDQIIDSLRNYRFSSSYGTPIVNISSEGYTFSSGSSVNKNTVKINSDNIAMYIIVLRNQSLSINININEFTDEEKKVLVDSLLESFGELQTILSNYYEVDKNSSIQGLQRIIRDEFFNYILQVYPGFESIRKCKEHGLDSYLISNEKIPYSLFDSIIVNSSNISSEDISYITENYPDYKGFSQIIFNPSVKADIKKNVIKATCRQKDVRAYCSYICEHLKDANDLILFIETMITENKRIRNKNDNIKNIISRIFIGNIRSIPIGHARLSQIKNMDKLFEKYPDIMTFDNFYHPSCERSTCSTFSELNQVYYLFENTLDNITVSEFRDLIKNYPEIAYKKSKELSSNDYENKGFNISDIINIAVLSSIVNKEHLFDIGHIIFKIMSILDTSYQEYFPEFSRDAFNKIKNDIAMNNSKYKYLYDECKFLGRDDDEILKIITTIDIINNNCNTFVDNINNYRNNKYIKSLLTFENNRFNENIVYDILENSVSSDYFSAVSNSRSIYPSYMERSGYFRKTSYRSLNLQCMLSLDPKIISSLYGEKISYDLDMFEKDDMDGVPHAIKNMKYIHDLYNDGTISFDTYSAVFKGYFRFVESEDGFSKFSDAINNMYNKRQNTRYWWGYTSRWRFLIPNSDRSGDDGLFEMFAKCFNIPYTRNSQITYEKSIKLIDSIFTLFKDIVTDVFDSDKGDEVYSLKAIASFPLLI